MLRAVRLGDVNPVIDQLEFLNACQRPIEVNGSVQMRHAPPLPFDDPVNSDTPHPFHAFNPRPTESVKTF